MTECNSRMSRKISEIEAFLDDKSVDKLSMTMFAGEKRRIEKCFGTKIRIEAVAKTEIRGLVKYKIIKAN